MRRRADSDDSPSASGLTFAEVREIMQRPDEERSKRPAHSAGPVYFKMAELHQ
jgi:hypothetical protein